MIVHSELYCGTGQRQPEAPEIVARDRAVSDSTFAWIDLHEPSAPELELVQRLFGLHDLAIEDAQTPHQRPTSNGTGTRWLSCCARCTISTKSRPS
jgi:magnesium transporter